MANLRTLEKQRTIESILQTSLSFFNENGVRNTSTHAIASGMNISTGNLTYHFKKKSDIVDELTRRFESEIVSVLAEIKSIDAVMQQHAEILVRILKVFWNYRFFFNSLMHISDGDVSKKKTYARLKKHIISTLAEGQERLIANGSMVVLDPEVSSEAFLENLWYLFLSHLRMYFIETPKSKVTEANYYAFAAGHLYSYLSPFYSEPLKVGYKEYLQAELLS